MKKLFIATFCIGTSLFAVFNPDLLPEEKVSAATAEQGSIGVISEIAFDSGARGQIYVRYTSQSHSFYLTQEIYNPAKNEWVSVDSAKINSGISMRVFLATPVTGNLSRPGDKYRFTLSTLPNGGGTVIDSKDYSLQNYYGTMKAITINSVTSASTNVIGTAEPSSTVQIKKGSTVIGTGKADLNGDYNIKIPAQVVGTAVTAQSALNGVTSNIASVTVTGLQTVGAIDPNKFIVGDTNITGTYSDDVVRARALINGASVSVGGSFENGSFKFFVGNLGIKTNDVVVLQALDANNRVLDNKTVTVASAISQGAITPNDYTVGATNITGSYTGTVARAELFVEGTRVSTGGTFANGNFTYFIPTGRIKEGDTVVLIAFDASGKELGRQTVRTVANTQGSIKAHHYTTGNVTITGNYTGDATKARLTVNGKVISWGGTFHSGTFSYYVGSTTIGAKDTVVLTVFDAKDNQLDEQNLTVLAQP